MPERLCIRIGEANMHRTGFAHFCSRIVFINKCRAKTIVTITPGRTRFFSRFKAELIEDGIFEDIEQARSEIFSYIEGYYNRGRLHSSLDFKSPMEFEQELQTENGGIKRQFFFDKKT